MYRARHADRQSEERPRYGLALDIKRVRRLGDRGRRDPDFLADRLQIGKCQAFLARQLSLGDLGPFRGGAEDGRHLLIVVSSLGHVSQVSSEASPEANSERCSRIGAVQTPNTRAHFEPQGAGNRKRWLIAPRGTVHR